MLRLHEYENYEPSNEKYTNPDKLVFSPALLELLYKANQTHENRVFLNALTTYLNLSDGDTHEIESCLINSISSVSFNFLLDRDVIKEFLDTSEMTTFVWNLLYRIEPRVKIVRETCSLLALSNIETKNYMRQSLVKIPMDMNVDLSEITL